MLNPPFSGSCSVEPQTSCRKFQSYSDSDSLRSTWTGGEEVTQRDSVYGGGVQGFAAVYPLLSLCVTVLLCVCV